MSFKNPGKNDRDINFNPVPYPKTSSKGKFPTKTEDRGQSSDSWEDDYSKGRIPYSSGSSESSFTLTSESDLRNHNRSHSSADDDDEDELQNDGCCRRLRRLRKLFLLCCGVSLLIIGMSIALSFVLMRMLEMREQREEMEAIDQEMDKINNSGDDLKRLTCFCLALEPALNKTAGKKCEGPVMDCEDGHVCWSRISYKYEGQGWRSNKTEKMKTRVKNSTLALSSSSWMPEIRRVEREKGCRIMPVLTSSLSMSMTMKLPGPHSHARARSHSQMCRKIRRAGVVTTECFCSQNFCNGQPQPIQAS